jgi:glycosyltransferase involved in cell wall biosynthesis
LKERVGFSFEVLHNIVDTAFFNAELKPARGDDIIFLNVASLDENKNQALAIRAFSREFKGRKAILRIGGDGPLRASLAVLAVELGVGHQVEFLGLISREAVQEAMQQADCFVLPSNFETFGVVLIEAMACGLPLVATRSGGPADIVTAENGILVDVGSEEQLAAAMVQMFVSSGAYPRAKVRSYAKSHFGEEAFVRNAVDLYARALT